MDLDAATHRAQDVRAHTHRVVGRAPVEDEPDGAGERGTFGAHPEASVHHDVGRAQRRRPVREGEVAVDLQASQFGYVDVDEYPSARRDRDDRTGGGDCAPPRRGIAPLGEGAEVGWGDPGLGRWHRYCRDTLRHGGGRAGGVGAAAGGRACRSGRILTRRERGQQADNGDTGRRHPRSAPAESAASAKNREHLATSLLYIW